MEDGRGRWPPPCAYQVFPDEAWLPALSRHSQHPFRSALDSFPEVSSIFYHWQSTTQYLKWVATWFFHCLADYAQCRCRIARHDLKVCCFKITGPHFKVGRSLRSHGGFPFCLARGRAECNCPSYCAQLFSPMKLADAWSSRSSTVRTPRLLHVC